MVKHILNLKEKLQPLLGEDAELPEVINADNLCDDVLGFEDLEAED